METRCLITYSMSVGARKAVGLQERHERNRMALSQRKGAQLTRFGIQAPVINREAMRVRLSRYCAGTRSPLCMAHPRSSANVGLGKGNGRA